MVTDTIESTDVNECGLSDLRVLTASGVSHDPPLIRWLD